MNRIFKSILLLSFVLLFLFPFVTKADILYYSGGFAQIWESEFPLIFDPGICPEAGGDACRLDSVSCGGETFSPIHTAYNESWYPGNATYTCTPVGYYGVTLPSGNTYQYFWQTGWKMEEQNSCGNGVCEGNLGEYPFSCSADCSIENCNDGVDNDGDGDIDGADSDCAVPPADFAITLLSPTSQTVNAGGSATYTVRVQSLNGMNGTVAVNKHSSFPNCPGVSCTSTPINVTPPVNGYRDVTFTINSVNASANPRFTGTWNGTSKNTAAGSLVVNSATYSYSVSPASLTFNYTPPGAGPSSQTITVTNTGNQTLNISVGESIGWASASASSFNNLLPGQSGNVTVSIDNPNQTPGSHVGNINFTNSQGAGNKTVPITLVVGGGCDTTPGTNFMKGCLYDGTNFNTITPTTVNQSALSSPAPNSASPVPYRDWGTGGPDPANVDTYSIRWKGTFNFTSGNYTFTVGGDDGVRLYFDDNLDGNPDSGYIVSDWNDHAYRTTASSPTAVSSGNHTLVMEYYENGGGASYSLSWAKTPPTGDIKANGQDNLPAVANGSDVTISWTSSGASSCSINPPSWGWSGTSGSQVAANMTVDTTFTLNCDGFSNIDSVVVDVLPPLASLQVNKSGQGSVTTANIDPNDPAQPDIDCASGCTTQTESYFIDTDVTLSATANTGRIISRWDGCDGGSSISSDRQTGTCDVTIGASGDTVNVFFTIDPDYQEF